MSALSSDRIVGLSRAMTVELPAPFAGVSEAAAAALAPSLSRRTLPANAVVYYQDDPAGAVYVIERGHMRLSHIMEDGSVALYAIIPAGASFGEAGAFDPVGYCDTASTIDEAVVTAIDLSWIGREGTALDELRTVLSRMIAARHRAHMQVTRALYLPNLAARLALAILRLVDELGNEVRYNGAMVPVLGPVVTQRDLGAMARGTRENVNKVLRTWIDAGLVAVEDRHIVILSRSGLEAVAFRM